MCHTIVIVRYEPLKWRAVKLSKQLPVRELGVFGSKAYYLIGEPLEILIVYGSL